MTAPAALAGPVVASDRRAVSLVFACHGAVFGTYATRVPWIQEHVHASPAQLGLALLMPGLGSILTMPVAGAVVHRWSGRAATRALLVVMTLGLALPALAPNLVLLCLAFFVLGAAAGSTDITMNAQAVRTEQRAGRAIMTSFHALWSAGTLAGSGIGVLAAHRDIDGRVHLGAVAIGLSVLGLLVSSRVSLNPPDPAREPSSGAALIALPPRPVIFIGIIGFCAVFAEGVTADWCAVYLRDVADAGPGLAASAYSATAVTMAAARFLGDGVVRWLGAQRSVRISGVVTTVGAALVVSAGAVHSAATALALAGFGLIGVGVAVVVPLAFTAAGRDPHPEQAIAGVATIAYGAGLLGPGLIGGLAQAFSLPVAFGMVVLLSLVVVAGAPALRDAVVASAGSQPQSA